MPVGEQNYKLLYKRKRSLYACTLSVHGHENENIHSFAFICSLRLKLIYINKNSLQHVSLKFYTKNNTNWHSVHDE